jgi:hypothetical protein
MSIKSGNDLVKREISHTLATEGEGIVNSVRYTDYQHYTEVDESTGTYIMDCSGFVSYVLECVAPAHFEMIPKEVNQPRPRAVKFYEFLSTLPTDGNGWKAIDRFADVRRGDIIAWRHPGPIKPHGDTGHVLIVARTPRAEADDLYSVVVYDSSNIPHNEDTRRDGVTGVGMGEIKFRTDCDGRPTSFQFEVRDSFYSYPIAIGRPGAFIDVTPLREERSSTVNLASEPGRDPIPGARLPRERRRVVK